MFLQPDLSRLKAAFFKNWVLRSEGVFWTKPLDYSLKEIATNRQRQSFI